MMRNPTIVMMVMLSVAWSSGGASAEILAPFPPRAPSERVDGPDCPQPPAPVVGLAVISKYGNDGPNRDTIDLQADRALKAQMAPIRIFSQTVVKMANRYTAHGSVTDAQCTLAWLTRWAQGHALTQMSNPNTQFERAQILAGLTIALLQVSPAIRPDPRFPVVAEWMTQLASSTNAFFDATHDRLKGSRNNHSYWAALASAGAAAVADDRPLWDWAIRTYRAGVCSSTAQGGLPLELDRGKKSREYHLFALNALVPVAAFAEANGVAAYQICNGAMHRIVKFTLQSIHDPSAIAAASGTEQEAFAEGQPSGRTLAFLQLYHLAFPGKAPMEKNLLARAPYIVTNMGGDQALLYGR